MLLKTAAFLFPTRDYRLYVVTPSLLLTAEALLRPPRARFLM